MTENSVAVDAHRLTQLRAFTSYILSRLNSMAFETDPALEYVMPLAELLGVPLEIRTAKMRVHEVFPPGLAWGVERLLTGQEWTEAEAGSARAER